MWSLILAYGGLGKGSAFFHELPAKRGMAVNTVLG